MLRHARRGDRVHGRTGCGGRRQIADRCCGVGGTPPSETGAAATGLPGTWSTGEVFPADGPVSAFGVVELDPTATPLLGDPFVEPQLDQNAPGRAEAFR